MPLIHGKSPKAFEKNLKTEMKHGKPQDQALAIAYSVKRQAAKKKKMAEGGAISAKTESRPSTQERDNDSKEVSRNSAQKPAKHDSWTDNSTVEQARKPSHTPLKHPKMVPTDAFSVRLRNDEDDLQRTASPGPYNEQPPRHDDEEDADRQGPDAPALHMKKMAKGGKLDVMIAVHPHQDKIDHHINELKKLGYAMGGEAEKEELPPEHEANDEKEEADESTIAANEAEEHSPSIADAILNKRKKMAHGGSIRSHGSTDTHEDADQADLSRNADEDANEEDQLSFEALKKENYSESEGLRQLSSPEDSNEHSPEHEEMDKHDRVSAIRRKMRLKLASLK